MSQLFWGKVLRRPYSWIGLLTIALAGAGTIAACTETTATEVRNKLKTDLPIGSERAAIDQWLEGEGIDVPSQGSVRNYSTLDGEDFAPDADVIFFGLHAGRDGLFVEKRVHVYLVLDEDGRLAGWHVEDVKTGP